MCSPLRGSPALGYRSRGEHEVAPAGRALRSRRALAKGGAEMRAIEVRTRSREEFVDITKVIRGSIEESGVREGVCHLWSLHTTAALTVNESADPAVATDLVGWLARAAPRDAGYRHLEGNSDAHIKTGLLGPGLSILVSAGRPVLGQWQGIFLCEFDGPRTRRVVVRITAAE